MSTNEQNKDTYDPKEDLDPVVTDQAEIDSLLPTAEEIAADKKLREVLANPAASLPQGTDPVILAMLGQLTKAVVALSEKAETGPIPQIPLTKIDPKNAFNPEGIPTDERPKLKHRTNINGYAVHPSRLFNRDIELLNQLKPGRYHGGQWTVVFQSLGTETQMDVFWPNKTEADRLEIAKFVGKGGMAAILESMVEEGNRITLAA